MARFADKAVQILAQHIEDNIGTYLDAVESEESLDAGSMEEPVAVLRYSAEFDNRAPLIQVFDIGTDVISQREGFYNVECSVIIALLGDADLGALQLYGRRYVTAMIKTLLSDQTLDGQSNQVIIQNTEVALQGDRSTTRLLYGIRCVVMIEDDGS